MAQSTKTPETKPEKKTHTVKEILDRVSKRYETVTIGKGGGITYRHGSIKSGFVRSSSAYGVKGTDSTVSLKMNVGAMIADSLGLAKPSETDKPATEAYWDRIEKELTSYGFSVRDGGKPFATFTNAESVSFSVDDLFADDTETATE